MHRVWAFIRLSRFHFLPLSVLCHAVGLVWVHHEGKTIDEGRLVHGLIIQLLIQLSAAYVNDYWDQPTDRINQRRTLLSGGSGELTTGVLPPIVALIAAAVCQITAFVWALALGLPSVSYGILLAVALIAVFYTAPPLQFAWRGLGEFTTAAVAAILVPQWAYSLHTGQIDLDLLAVQMPLLPWIMALFVAIAAPDYDADRQVQKRTLPVIFGAERVGRLYAILTALGYALAMIFWWGRVPAGVGTAALICLPLTIWAWAGLRFHLDRDRAALAVIIRVGLMPLILLVVLITALRIAS
jgi:1,4-dihydroxy-2-naphthoate octaprenyltransferase